uniref:Uncharacterized protein n=1 Tax=Rhizophora mucronata TaxID=61149 RepID=A0A2P2QUZ6_RHIMU
MIYSHLSHFLLQIHWKSEHNSPH